VHFCKFISCPR